MKETLILLLLIITLIVFFETNKSSSIISNIDQEKYVVRNVSNKKDAANLLAKIKNKLINLTEYLYSKKNNKYSPYIKRLKERIYNCKFKERLLSIFDFGIGKDKMTSYTFKKGEYMALCLRSEDNEKIHNENLITYVALHELAHIACPEYGHTILFLDIFRYLVSEGINMGIYKYINYEKNPVKYCGIRLDSSIISKP